MLLEGIPHSPIRGKMVAPCWLCYFIGSEMPDNATELLGFRS